MCGQFLLDADAVTMRRFLELSWAGVRLSDDSLVNNDAITMVMARLGLYRQNVDEFGHFELMVPLYVQHTFGPSVRSLLAICQIVDKGDRFECGFRRILQLRFSCLRPCTCWSNMGLPFLTQSGVPFPAQYSSDAFVFPKIVKENSWTVASVKHTMDVIHSRGSLDTALRQEFGSSAMPELIRCMKVGHYYQPVAKSGSADALIKVSNTSVVSFQFKNLKDPITAKVIAKEAYKCRAAGIQMWLVVVCSSGNERNVDYVYHLQGVTVVVLSKQSVEFYIGSNCLRQFTSNSLIGDLSDRIDISPNKDDFLLQAGVDIDKLWMSRGENSDIASRKRGLSDEIENTSTIPHSTVTNKKRLATLRVKLSN